MPKEMNCACELPSVKSLKGDSLSISFYPVKFTISSQILSFIFLCSIHGINPNFLKNIFRLTKFIYFLISNLKKGGSTNKFSSKELISKIWQAAVNLACKLNTRHFWLH